MPDRSAPQRTTQDWARLIAAYSATDYCIALSQPGVIRIGQVPVWPAAEASQLAAWCVISADNPGSIQRSAAINALARHDLHAQLHSTGMAFWPSLARANTETGEWPAEHGFLVAFADFLQARTWARTACVRWQQLAVVMGQQHSAARLYFWRGHPHFGQTAMGIDPTSINLYGIEPGIGFL